MPALAGPYPTAFAARGGCASPCCVCRNRPGFRNAISLDQLAAEKIGGLTRFPSLALSGEGAGLSWTRTGALVPASTSPAKVFAKLFLDGKPDEVKAQVTRLADGRSVLDDVHDERHWRVSTLGGDAIVLALARGSGPFRGAGGGLRV